jgi:DNA-directed RNA polymerase I subunit RPA1
MDVINRKEQGLEVNESDDENLDGNFDDDQTDSEGSVDDANRRNKENNEADKYLAAIEVEAQIKLLWQEHAEFLNFIWTRSLNRMDGSLVIDLKKAEGWKVFFMRAVVVTPNKFRPASIVGDQMSEHPQNLHLKKIIELNSQIRIMKSKGGNSFAGDLDASPNSDSNEDGGFQLSKLISAWIDLQNAVNCYMDASKDPNSALPDHNSVGIKQILERKEGLFRRHMMGKRVNFCCRSVISPDPYLGTNEIGIPIRFAKELYYPVPVNDWNVKYLRKLVERGPDQYPGEFFSLTKCSVLSILYVFVVLFDILSSMTIQSCTTLNS